MNMSFINRASPHEVLSFFTQPIYPSAKDWLTMDVIQSAIMTSSLINLPLAEGEPCLQFAAAHTRGNALTPAHGGNCVSCQQALFLSLWDHGKVFQPQQRLPSGDGCIGRLACPPSTRWCRMKCLSPVIGWITITFGADNHGSEWIVKGMCCLEHIFHNSQSCSNLRRPNNPFCR